MTSRVIDALISQVDRVNFSTKRVLTRNLIPFLGFVTHAIFSFQHGFRAQMQQCLPGRNLT